MLSTARGRVAILTTLAILAVALLTAGSASAAANGKIAFSFGVDVWTINADGTNPAEFTAGQAGSGSLGGDEAAWSPDGTKIAYATQDTPNSEAIFWMPADGGAATKIVDNRTVPTGLNRKPTWSPDGTKIAFHSLVGGQWEIYSINIDGSGLTNLSENAASDFFPAWSHDGTKIAFASTRDGGEDIWVMNADGSNPTRLTTAVGRDILPSWSANDSQIVFVSERDGDGEIYKMNADGSDQVRLTSSYSTDAYPEWSPDGTKIAFMSVRANVGAGITQIFVMDTDGSNVTQITDLAAPGATKPAWQPVGTAPPPPPTPGTVRIFLDANPDGSQDFAFAGSGAIGNFDLDDDAEPTLPSIRSFTGLTAGSYTVQQIIPNTWTVVGLTCTDPDNGSSTDVPSATATIDLDAGETVDCQYLDVPATGTRIRIQVDAVPDDAQDFSFSGSGAIGGFDLDDDADPGLPAFRQIPLSPGSFTVQQAVPAGWNLTSLVCVDPDAGSSTSLGSATATIDLDAGETVTCTYTDAPEPPPPPTGTFVIQVDAVPDAAQDFGYDVVDQPLPPPGGAGNIFLPWSLDDDGDAALPSSLSFSNQYTGSYTIAQDALPTGWDLTGITCVDPDGGSSANIADQEAIIDLDDGETVTCTFTNAPLPPPPPPPTGTFVIQVDAVPDAAQDFGYDVVDQPLPPPGGAGNIFLPWSLDDDGDAALPSSLSFSNQYTGSYTIAQDALPTGWDLTGITCVDPDGGSIGNLVTGQATIDLDAGETVTCVYTNTKDTVPPTLTLPASIAVNAAGPAGATVSYTASASDNVDPSPTLSCVPGSGNVFAIGVTTVNCTATDVAGNSATGSFTIRVRGAGEQITLLSNKTVAYVGPPALEAALTATLRAAATALAAGRRPVACTALALYVATVRLTPTNVLSAAQKSDLIGDATRIRTVSGC